MDPHTHSKQHPDRHLDRCTLVYEPASVLVRRWMKEQEQQCSSPVNTRPGTPTNENISDAGVIPSVMRAIVRPALQLEGLPVLNILSKLRDEIPGFMYRYIVDRDGQLAGWCYTMSVPTLTSITETVFTDNGVSDAPVSKFLPNAVHNICAFHVIDLDIFKCAKENHYNLAEQLWQSLCKVVRGRSVESVRIFFVELLQKRMPLALKKYLEKCQYLM